MGGAGGTGLKLKLKLGGAEIGTVSTQLPKGKAEPKVAKREKREKRKSSKRKSIDDDYEYGNDSDFSDPEVSGSKDDYYVLGQEDEEFKEYRDLELKPDAHNRPLWVCPDGRIFLETSSYIYKQAYDFLIAVAEPVSRPECIHEYALTPHSLYAAVSVGLDTETIINVLNRLSKVQLPESMKKFVRTSTENYGKVKLVLQRNKFYVESPFPQILRKLLRDSEISEARADAGEFVIRKALKEKAAAALENIDVSGKPEDEEEPNGESGSQQESGPEVSHPTFVEEDVVMEEDPERAVYAFEVKPEKVERVKARCLPDALNYPMLEEYDFRNDTVNPDLNYELKPIVRHRPYQEKSLSKMFGNGRARSGIIVLPCGAGKSLVGVSAAARVKKSCLCLVTNTVSVDQWRHQFKLWTTIQDHQLSRFTSDSKEMFAGASGVMVTTYTMIAFGGQRNEASKEVMDAIQNREWGLLLMDEVHVVPAGTFRKVIGIIKAHCKLGLTATLVREDQRITDLNFLIGPKLYEANWLDLTRAGHIANVQCAEVWCEMTKEFFREYLKPQHEHRRQLLYAMNPNKFQACQFLIEYHERVRGDKVIVFSDNIFALREYAVRMRKPFIYGATSHQERTRILHAFKHDPNTNTVFLSKIGDTSIDIPEANVLIQVSSHAGSRRQEAQRLGRILRAKKGKPGTNSAEEYNAFFYTLVSKDTKEMYYSLKRQQFLIDQGYAFKVITNLLDNAGGMNLGLSDKDEQRNLLAAVLATGAEEAQEENLGIDKDDVGQIKRTAKRAKRNMADLSGASGLTYVEFSSKTNKSKTMRKLDKIARKAATPKLPDP